MFLFNILDATKGNKGNSVPCSQCHVTSSPLHSTVASQRTLCRSEHQPKQPIPPKDVILTVDKQLFNQPSKVMVVCSRQHVEDLNHSNVVQYMWCDAENIPFCFIWREENWTHVVKKDSPCSTHTAGEPWTFTDLWETFLWRNRFTKTAHKIKHGTK